ncbi:MAG: hypothetical protein CVU90_06785 [Firmicutes bacterium HGW-Firmicutes-15]|nr:MAG: hypothetical protein CVU90_06785 [Firmicutes bacterium HGW-Firmicutes-15]
MLELDFAFFNMRDSNRQGLANRKSFLDRLAPVLFSPRVKQLIHFGKLGFKGCNVLLPLGEGNWSILNPHSRGRMIEKTEAILNNYELPRMGVDRRLKSLFLTQEYSLPIVFGDHFISALAAILVEKTMALQDIKKLILVGDIPDMCPLLNNVSRYHIPISVQNYHPVRNEIMVHRLLYEKGLAVSNSYVNPHNWGRGDLIVSFEPGSRSLAIASPEVFGIRLDDDSSGLAPELEQVLAEAGLNPKINTLAPILETCLLAQAGYLNPNGEDIHQALIDAGDGIGIWEPFLDNGL